MAAPSDSSNLQMTIFGSYALGAGLCSIFKPELSLLVFSPLTSTIEKLTGLPALVLNDDTAPVLAAFGGLASAIGFYYFLAVRSNDEKFKKNTVPGRLFFGSLCLAVSAFTSKGTGFTVALGLGDILAAILMGNTVGGFAGASK